MLSEITKPVHSTDYPRTVYDVIATRVYFYQSETHAITRTTTQTTPYTVRETRVTEAATIANQALPRFESFIMFSSLRPRVAMNT